MSRRPSVVIVIAVCGLAIVACQKLPEQPQIEAEFDIEPATFTDAIPLDYGDLVSVTPSGSSPYWCDLWFQSPDQTIVVVRVNTSVGAMHDSIITIPRR